MNTLFDKYTNIFLYFQINVAPQGFEPQLNGPKPFVLPLHHRPITRLAAIFYSHLDLCLGLRNEDL